MRTAVKSLVLALLVLLLAGCLPGDGTATIDEPAGFLWGVWHGWVAPISLILSIFRPWLSIYETFNTGFWYDLGFYAAVIAGFGGLSLSRSRARNRRERRDGRDDERY